MPSADYLLSDIPAIAEAWADEQPIDTLTWGGETTNLRKFTCRAGHQPRTSAATMLLSGCPSCQAQRTKADRTTNLATVFPEVAAQWHPSRNNPKLSPDRLPPLSTRAIWWQTACCGHEWQESPRDRQRPRPRESGPVLTHEKTLCPACDTILNSLAVKDPDLAATWHPDNLRTPWQVLPASSYTARWQCTVDPAHIWTSTLARRSGGTGCPSCSTAGTSGPEKLLVSALSSPDAPVTPSTVPRRSGTGSWRVDGLVTLKDGQRLVVEYDGAYWHKDKTDTDLRKTVDLLAAGALVVRVREHPLPDLPFTAPRLLQISFRPRTDLYKTVATAVYDWCNQA